MQTKAQPPAPASNDDKPQMQMDAQRLARLAYAAMADQVHRLQLHIVQQEAVNARFGDDALPVDSLMRSYTNLLGTKSGKDIAERLGQRETMREYLDAMRVLEELFELQEKQDIKDFVDAMRERFRADEAADKKRK